MSLIQRFDVSHPIMLMMLDSSDHVTGKTGLTLTVTKSKNGGTYAAWSGTSAEVANGIYKLTAGSGDVDTLGELAIHAEGAGADPSDELRQVIAFDPYSATNLGLSAMPIDLTQTVSDVTGSPTTIGGILTILRAMANGKMTVVSGLLKLFGTNGTTQVGVDRTVTGNVPADFSRA
jgi:hypothetical protein